MGKFQIFIASCKKFLIDNRSRFRPSGALSDPKLVRAKELRKVAVTFLDGFTVASELSVQKVQREVGSLPQAVRGVCYEGAAAGKTVRDLTANEDLSEASELLRREEEYSFLVYLGIGEALAQMKLPPQLCNAVAKERWAGQIIEGYGFFDGYFNWHDALVNQRYPQGLEPGLKAAYDQGLGRAIYFATNCDPIQMRDMISCFSEDRRAEIWSGIGIPTAYVGGLTEREFKKFLNFAGPYRAELMQGILLGASARAKQNAIPDHTELACNMILGETTFDAMRYTEPLTSLLQEREQFTMFDWQSLVRAELRKDGR